MNKPCISSRSSTSLLVSASIVLDTFKHPSCKSRRLSHLEQRHDYPYLCSLPEASAAPFRMVYGDHGSSLALVSRYALSLSWVGTVTLIASTLSSSF